MTAIFLPSYVHFYESAEYDDDDDDEMMMVVMMVEDKWEAWVERLGGLIGEANDGRKWRGNDRTTWQSDNTLRRTNRPATQRVNFPKRWRRYAAGNFSTQA